MNGGLGDLYQEVIIDHGRRPRNFGELDDATQSAEGVNPLCGDELTLYVKLTDGRIDDVAFKGAGCAISQASASLMTSAIKGKTRDEALALFGQVQAMLTEGPDREVRTPELGKLEVFSGVWQFPMRVKCATLAWHTMRSALELPGNQVAKE